MKVLVLDKNDPLLIQGLVDKKYEIEEDYQSDYSQILNKIHHYHGVILRSRIPLDKKIIQQATQLKWIARVGAGLENIDLTQAKAQNIKVYHASGGNSNAVGEHALAMLLNLLHNIGKSHLEIKENLWQREENRGVELKGKTIGIIGYGNTGKAFAKKLSGFDVKVLYYDIQQNLEDNYAKEADMQTIFEETEVLSLHIPLTHETTNLVNKEYISKFKKLQYIINTARGSSLVTKDVLDVLDVGILKGACLDVLEFEKTSFEKLASENPTFKRLLQSNKVILTPHIAGWSFQSKKNMAEIILHKILYD